MYIWYIENYLVRFYNSRFVEYEAIPHQPQGVIGSKWNEQVYMYRYASTFQRSVKKNIFFLNNKDWLNKESVMVIATKGADDCQLWESKDTEITTTNFNY